MPVSSVDCPSPDQLAARRQLDAAREAHRDRKRDARRKIITGAALLAEAEHDPAVGPVSYTHLDVYKRQAVGQVVRSVLQARVTRPIDRAVLADLLD